MKALWLTSWYPHKYDKFTGDFIQRHAFAASLYTSIQVIHVQLISRDKMQEEEALSFTEHGNLKEQVVLIRASGLLFPFNKIADHLNYIKTYKRYTRLYLQKEGKPNIIHVHVAVKAGLVALSLKRKLNIPFVVTEHWTIYNADSADRIEKKSFLFRYVNKLILKHASLLLPVSDDLGVNIRRKIYPVASHTVLNVVDTNVFNYQPKTKEGGFIFLHVSVMNEQKNPEAILRAFAAIRNKVNDVKLYMVGPASAALNTYAASLHIPSENIEFTGEIPYHKVAAYMQMANVLVMFSNYENMPCVILEALCCGLPVISAHVGGIAEVLTNENGYLLPPKNEPALYNVMLDVINDPGKFNALNISSNAQARFSYKKIGKEIEELYKKVINEQDS